jgi:hypothetical protein
MVQPFAKFEKASRLSEMAGEERKPWIEKSAKIIVPSLRQYKLDQVRRVAGLLTRALPASQPPDGDPLGLGILDRLSTA